MSARPFSCLTRHEVLGWAELRASALAYMWGRGRIGLVSNQLLATETCVQDAHPRHAISPTVLSDPRAHDMLSRLSKLWQFYGHGFAHTIPCYWQVGSPGLAFRLPACEANIWMLQSWRIEWPSFQQSQQAYLPPAA
jgi:hypothetical protein